LFLNQQQLLIEKMGFLVSDIYFLVMLVILFQQLKIWKKNPDLISSNVQLRSLYFIFGFTVFIFISFYLMTIWPVDWWALALSIAMGVSSGLLTLTGSLLFLTSLLIVRPWEISKTDAILNSLPRLSALIIFVMLCLRVIKEKKIKIFWTKECSILILFSVWLYFTSGYSSVPGASYQFFLENFSKCVILFFLVLNTLRTTSDVSLFAKTLLASSVGACLLAFIYSLGFDQSESTGRLTFIGLLGDPNDMTAFAMLSLPFALTPLWKKDEPLISWITALILFSITVTAIFLAQSRGAILAFLALVMCIFIYLTKNKKLAFLISIAIALLYYPMQGALNRQPEDLKQSGSSRLIYWKTAINMAIRNPLVGVGFNDYPNQYETYLTDTNVFESGKRTAHSTWFLVLAENGLIGFFLFVSLYLFSVFKAFRMRVSNPEYLFSLISYGVAMSFLSHTYIIYPYLLFGFTIVSFDIFSKNLKI
jgi:putative inorganic carbon (HCO3(-)) transporter